MWLPSATPRISRSVPSVKWQPGAFAKDDGRRWNSVSLAWRGQLAECVLHLRINTIFPHTVVCNVTGWTERSSPANAPCGISRLSMTSTSKVGVQPKPDLVAASITTAPSRDALQRTSMRGVRAMSAGAQTFLSRPLTLKPGRARRTLVVQTA